MCCLLFWRSAERPRKLESDGNRFGLFRAISVSATLEVMAGGRQPQSGVLGYNYLVMHEFVVATPEVCSSHSVAPLGSCRCVTG
jgi:hypothetical protein